MDFLERDEKKDIALLLVELLSVMTQNPIVSSPVIVFEITLRKCFSSHFFTGSM